MNVLTFSLVPAARVPRLAYGTGTFWFARDQQAGVERPINSALVESAKAAIKLGFRHLDAAEMYGTERELGMAIKESISSSLVTREDLFVTSKLLAGAADPQGTCRSLLERMQLDYFDLFLLHAPFLPEGVTLQQTWGNIELLLDSGLVKSIGVSNFRVSDLKELAGFAKVQPSVNQVEFHAYLQQPELITYCRDNNIHVYAYSSLVPLVHCTDGPVDALVKEIASRRGMSQEQVLLSWVLQKGLGAVTTSRSEERLTSFLQLAKEDNALKLSANEVKAIDEAGAQKRFRKFWVDKFND